MSGTLMFKPIEAQLTRDTDMFTKMDPYVKIILGDQEIKGKVCHMGGKNPTWSDHITVQRRGESICYAEVMDKDLISADDLIGVAQIDLDDVEARNVTARWYPLYFEQRQAGEILFEIIWTPDPVSANQEQDNQNKTLRFGTF